MKSKFKLHSVFGMNLSCRAVNVLGFVLEKEGLLYKGQDRPPTPFQIQKHVYKESFLEQRNCGKTTFNEINAEIKRVTGKPIKFRRGHVCPFCKKVFRCHFFDKKTTPSLTIQEANDFLAKNANAVAGRIYRDLSGGKEYL